MADHIGVKRLRTLYEAGILSQPIKANPSLFRTPPSLGAAHHIYPCLRMKKILDAIRRILARHSPRRNVMSA